MESRGRSKQLADFVQHKIRMTHMYQPVMLMALMENAGTASAREIAQALLAHDESQLDYYRTITGNMVGRILRGHGLVQSEGIGWDRRWTLIGFDELTEKCIQAITDACLRKLDRLYFTAISI